MEAIEQKKRNVVRFLLDSNVLIEPDFLEELNSIKEPSKISELVNKKLLQIKISEEDKAQIFDTNKQKITRNGIVKIVFSYKNIPKKNTAQDFFNYFNARYTAIKKILQQRTQLENTISIGRLKGKSEKEQTAIIGMVSEKEDTKNGIMITVEDPTGAIKVFFSRTKLDLTNKAKDVVHDEVIGITGVTGKNIVFANDLFFPDIPITKEMKRSLEDEYVVFISDVHVGSTLFLEDEFLRFIKWISGEVGNDAQRAIASKVKYLFVTGDCVDGISVYPTQKSELNLFTYKDQYKKFAEYMKLIPQDIQIIICPGNHDMVPLAEPQTILPKEYCEDLYSLPNVTMVSNPAIVNIGSRTGFPGFDVLMYHGYSYNYYADVVENIRTQKPNISERADLVMKFLLQKRHLAPTYHGNPHLMTDVDYLMIEKIPDIIVSGDVHRSAVFSYKHVITGIIGSCFQARTAFQDKVGHVPDPGRVPIMNLKTREVKVLNFSQEGK